MTTPIMNVLDIAQQPPFVVGLQDCDRFTIAITALYEQQTKSDREAMLLDDYMSLLLRHRMATGIGMFERNEKIQESIEVIASLLLSIADGLNTRLPDSFIKQCKESTEESASRFYKIIAEAYITPTWKKTQKNAHSGTNGTEIGSNATTTPQTPPAGKETPQIAVLRPYTPKRKGRTAIPFAETIADKDSSEKEYTAKQKAIIESNIKTALANMTDPKAVIALFVVYFKNGILKQCPKYSQALSLIDIEGLKDPNEKQKHCPFGMHQRYGKLRNIYFEKDNNYLSLNETDIKQNNEISPFVIEAEKKLKDLQAALKPKTATKRAKKNPAGTA